MSVGPSVIPDPSQAEREKWARLVPGAFGRSPRRMAVRWLAAVLGAVWLVALCWWFDITPRRLYRGLSGLLVVVRQMWPPSPGEQWRDILVGLGQSVAMALLGTFAAAVVALPLGFLGARNVVVNALAHFSLRRVFDGFRGMDQLIWALAFVRAVGLGPLAGVLALFMAEVAVLAKTYAEAIENADRKPVEGVLAAGGGRLLAIRFGLLPQVLPVLLAQVLYAFESNVRSASILGVVGAGGIGLQIKDRISVRYWDQVAFIVLLILLTVAVIDYASSRIRRRLIA